MNNEIIKSNKVTKDNEIINLDIKGIQDFIGIKIPIIEGGFGTNCRVITANTIAEIHNMKLKHINEIINNNIGEFEFGIDILDLKNSVGLTDSLLLMGYNKQKIANSKNIYLLSEQGYMLLVGFMKTDKSKDIRKQLRREYFAMREVINTQIDKENLALLKIIQAKDKADMAIALQEYRTQIVVPLQEKVIEMEPKANYYDMVLQCKDLISITNIAKDYGMTAQQMNNKLNKLNIQYKLGKTWLLYKKYANKGYTSTKTHTYIDKSGNNHTTLLTYWTQKGRLFIYELLKKDNILPLIEQ